MVKENLAYANQKRGLGKIVSRCGIYILLVILLAIMGILESSFFSGSNLINILRQTSTYAILAFGMTFVVLGGYIDLSVGAVLALCSCVVALLMKAGINMWLAVILAIIAGGICGFVNGFCLAKLKVPFFICTAGMMYIARGLALVITNENPVSGLPEEFNIFGNKPEWVIPPQVIIAIIVFFVCFFILKYTKMGRYTYAVGSSQQAAKLSGINVDKVNIWIFIIAGLCAGIAGVVQASRLKIGSPIIADGYELDTIAAVAIGGASLLGGEGSIVRTVIGALILTVIRVGLNMLGIQTSMQQVVIGLVIIVVVALDMRGKKRS